ncbi:hypothetical protein Cme02nite_51530 [Catellatospora methionotrophica]|uniref:Tetracyclin repressor-like C-terminal domain-containing protein n=1 Tax=Catellatospora methionotrophica TaxID=121620 RepID=A0A8J3LKF7_9ACTN|nr:hypothetical protein [Catellatospora methionotrophica]GIG16821.1 hypothetical protein Cme02nite_51530 [Catellatospora methionotrophica]
MPGTRDVDLVVEGGPRTLPERVAAAYVDRMEHGFRDDPLVAVLRSAVLIGVRFCRYVVGVGPVAQMSPQQLQEHLTRLVRSALFD